ERGLAGAVGGHAGDRVLAGERRDHHDLAAAAGEVGDGRARQPEDGGEVRADDVVPGLVVGLFHARELADAGVVDEQLQAAEARNRGGDRGVAGRAAPQIADGGDATPAGSLDLGDERVEL